MDGTENYSVGIYCRLSRDDSNGKNESLSIENQRSFLEEYVRSKSWNLCSAYTDDGYSGSNFERPAFRKMIADIEQGLINCVVTRDLGRLGREYITTGYYIEMYFRKNRVRFIAVNDNVDTQYEDNLLAPFLNIFNELYPREISRKVRQVKRAHAEEGKFMGSQPPYGYIRSPKDKYKLIVDKEAAPVIQRVFQLFLDGDSGRVIAEKLNAEGVDPPRLYQLKQAGRAIQENKRHLWGSTMALALTKNPVYLGHMVQGKREVTSFRCKDRRAIHPDDWIIVKDTHEPIIEQGIWDEVQRVTSERRIIHQSGERQPHIFTRLLICADCGSRLVSSLKKSRNVQRRIYKCSTYNNNGGSACSAHYLDEDYLKSKLTEELAFFAKLAVEKGHHYKYRLMELADMKIAQDLDTSKTELAKEEKRVAMTLTAIKQLCIQNYEGNISGAAFSEMLCSFNQEQQEAREKSHEIKQRVAQLKERRIDLDQWIATVKSCYGIKTLDRDMVLRLVDHFIVYERKGDDTKPHVEICYRHVGMIRSTDFSM